MPMLADLDDPPRSRVPGLLVGFAIAIPVGALMLGWMIPALVAAVLGGAQSADERLRAEDAYMEAVCSTAFDLARDESLCECALAVEYPALDCQAPFLAWSVERQQAWCAVEEQRDQSVSFCACVGAVAEAMAAASADDGRNAAASAYRNCQELPDAVYLPTIEALMPAG